MDCWTTSASSADSIPLSAMSRATRAGDRRAIKSKTSCSGLLKSRFIFDNYVIKREFTARSADDGDWSLRRLVKSNRSGKLTPKYVASFATSREDDRGG